MVYGNEYSLKVELWNANEMIQLKQSEIIIGKPDNKPMKVQFNKKQRVLEGVLKVNKEYDSKQTTVYLVDMNGQKEHLTI